MYVNCCFFFSLFLFIIVWDSGKIFFFILIKKIIGNFSFFVVCNVISVMVWGFFLMLFIFEISVKFVKKFMNLLLFLFLG